jgi:hypothetical protein
MQPTPIVLFGILFLSQSNFPEKERKRAPQIPCREIFVQKVHVCVCERNQTTINARAKAPAFMWHIKYVITGLELTVTVFLSRSFQKGVFSSVTQHGL